MKVLPRRRKSVLLNSVLATALLAIGGVAWATVAQGSSSTGSTATTRPATVQRGTVLATVSGSGTLTSPSDAGVNFTTGGTLTEVDVTAGQKVKAGQVLAKVDATSADETLTNAQSQLTAAQANLTQVEAGETPATSSNSGGSGSGSGGSGSGSGSGRGTTTTPTPTPTPTVNQAQLANAEQQVTSAQNAVAAAQRAVDGTVLKAPVAGTIASVSGKVGGSVSGSGGSGSGGSGGSGASGGGSGSGNSSSSSSGSLSGFVVITNPTGMEVSADFSESDALKLKAGQAATVTLNADTSQVLNAKVVSISSLPVSSSGSGGGSSSAVQYAALLAITGDTSNLRTGLSASVQVTTGEASGALYLPTSAINGTGANASVNVVQSDGTTKRTPVTLGVQGDSDDQILSGLTEGQRVQITVVSASGSNGFPSTGFPGGFGGGGGFGGRGGRGGGGGGGGVRTGGGGQG